MIRTNVYGVEEKSMNQTSFIRRRRQHAKRTSINKIKEIIPYSCFRTGQQGFNAIPGGFTSLR